jgi:hypothetical protein
MGYENNLSFGIQILYMEILAIIKAPKSLIHGTGIKSPFSIYPRLKSNVLSIKSDKERVRNLGRDIMQSGVIRNGILYNIIFRVGPYGKRIMKRRF